MRAFGPINVPTNVSFDFEIVFTNPCKVATFTIDPSILSANPIEYELSTETMIEYLDLSKITSSAGDPSICPDILISVLDASEQPTDGSDGLVLFDSENDQLQI